MARVCFQKPLQVCALYGAFTQQQVDQDLLAGQSVAPRQAHNRPDDPRDAVAGERQQGDHGAAASPRGRRVGAHPHALGQADVDGEERVHGDAFKRGVELHAVLLRHLARLPLVLAAAVGGLLARLTRLVLDWSGPPCATPALRGGTTAAAAAAAQWLLVQRHELGSAQDAVPLPRHGSRTRGHVLDGANLSSVGAGTD